MSRNIRFPILLFSLIPLLFCGCALFRRRAALPPVYAIYHAYPSLEHSPERLSPVPAYFGSWPEERQNRDISRISATCIKGLLLLLHPQDLASPERFSRMERFLEKAHAAQLEILLGLHSDTPMRLHAEDLEKFLAAKQILQHPALGKWEGMPILLFSGKMELAGTPPRSFAIKTLGKDWTLSETEPELTGDRLCWIAAGLWQNGEWIAPRGKWNFRSRLDAAAALAPHAILLSSWNCYQDGSAVEYNTLDGDQYLRLLEK